MMLVWSLFLLVCLVSDKATGKKRKKEKVLCLQLSSGGLTAVMWWMTWGLEMLL